MNIHLKLIYRCCVEQVEGIELEDIIVTPVHQAASHHSTVDRQAARLSERRVDRDAARYHRVARQTPDRRRRQSGSNTSSNAVCAPTPNSNANALTSVCPMPTRPLGGDVTPHHVTSTPPPHLLPPRARSFVYQHRDGEKPAAHGRSPCDGKGRRAKCLRDIKAACYPCLVERGANYDSPPYRPSKKSIINRQHTPIPRRSRHLSTPEVFFSSTSSDSSVYK